MRIPPLGERQNKNTLMIAAYLQRSNLLLSIFLRKVKTMLTSSAVTRRTLNPKHKGLVHHLKLGAIKTATRFYLHEESPSRLSE
jgi:hypothetical protein